MLSDLIRSHLMVLSGLQVRYIGRSGNMGWIGFGQDVSLAGPKNSVRVVAKYAIHIQCAFRVLTKDSVLFGSSDMYEPADNTIPYSDFDWDVLGANYYDVCAQRLSTEFGDNKVIVTRIEVTTYGDVSIMLSNNMVIEVFIDNGTNSESFRFFEPGNKDSHVVVTGHGIEQ